MSTGRLSDLEKIDFLESYIRHNLDMHKVAAEFGIKYNCASMRLLAIKKDSAKRRGDDVQSSGGKKNGSSVRKNVAKPRGGGKPKVTPTTTPSKKRKVMSDNEFDEEDEVVEGEGGKDEVEKEKGINGVESHDLDYDFA